MEKTAVKKSSLWAGTGSISGPAVPSPPVGMPIKRNLGGLGLQSAASNRHRHTLSGTNTELHQLDTGCWNSKFSPKMYYSAPVTLGHAHPPPPWACPLQSIIHLGVLTPPPWGAPTPIRSRQPPIGRAPLQLIINWGAYSPNPDQRRTCTLQLGISLVWDPLFVGALKHPVKNVCTSARHIYCLRSPFCWGSETSSEECVHFS